MGYTLKIGELEVNYDKEEEYISLEAKSEKHDNAPAFGEPTDYTNSRWPSYSSWSDFCKFAGLYDLFFNKETGLIREHPGCVVLTERHKEEIDKAYNEFKKKYPNAVAAYSPIIDYSKGVYSDEEWPEENGLLCRLEWLKYWVDWALVNCERPVFYNS